MVEALQRPPGIVEWPDADSSAVGVGCTVQLFINIQQDIPHHPGKLMLLPVFDDDAGGSTRPADGKKKQKTVMILSKPDFL